MNAGPHDLETPSPWVVRWVGRLPPGGRVLDIACGNGRHARYLAARGHAIEAVDRDSARIAALAGVEGISARHADLENAPWPYGGQQFSGIVVVHYLHRPLFPYLLAALATPGVLIYETFAAGNERFGRPTNPAFLLRPGELLEVVRGHLEVIAYEALEVSGPRPAMLQRICAAKSTAA